MIVAIRFIEIWKQTDLVAINRYGGVSFAASAIQEHVAWNAIEASIDALGGKKALRTNLLNFYRKDVV